MRRGSKLAKSKETKPPVARISPKDNGARVRDLEKRLSEALQREAEALARETATGEILRVISSSPTDAGPVFDAIVKNAVMLCGGLFSIVLRFDGELIHFVAHHNFEPDALDAYRRWFPRRAADDHLVGRALVEQRIMNVADVTSEFRFVPGQREQGFRSVLFVPMIRDGVSIGVIGVSRTMVGAFPENQVELLQTFADQAVIAIENVRLLTETKEALERQTATSEILRVISTSPTDLQPVFDAIVTSAVRLCDGSLGTVVRVDDDRLDMVAHYNVSHEGLQAYREHYPMPIGRETVAGNAILDRRVINVIDAQDDATVPPRSVAMARAAGFRGVVAVPLLRNGEPIGLINVSRRDPGLFSDQHIALLQTFADQAVIAIENVRLFNETKEALDQQTATSEILGVISRSPTDVQPVFDTIAASAARLCKALDAVIWRLDGDMLRLVAHHGPIPFGRIGEFTVPSSPDTVTGRTVITSQTIQVHDLASAEEEYPEGAVHARLFGYRTFLSTPLLRQGVPLGTVALRRTEIRKFSDKEIALLQTFADQAAIAIENVRLFKELEASNRELTTALDKQTATSEILRAIAHAPTDTQPVFDTIVRSAAELCHAAMAAVFLTNGQMVDVPANYGASPEALAAVRARFPRPVDMESTGGMTILTRSVVHVSDIEESSAVELVRHSGRLMGFRSLVTVPMLRGGEAVGAIGLYRREPGRFSDAEVALLQTFADQAVIAIENVRLFTELQEKNLALTQAHAQVTEALEQQTATSELLKVIGRSTFDLQPVFETLAENAARLCEAEQAAVFRFDGQHLRAVTVTNEFPELTAFITQNPIPPGHGSSSGRAALERRTIHIADIRVEPGFTWGVRELAPIRTVLSIPMLRADELLGVISVNRHEVRSFSDSQIALLETFADQAAIAIENARLLSELQARTEELTRSVGQLTALGEVGRAVSSTLDLDTVLSTIVSRAIQLSGTDGGSVYEYDEATEEFTLRASRELPEAYVEQVRDTRPRKGEGAVGRVAQTREPVQIADISDPAAYESRVRNTLLQIGLRALLAVPLIAEDQLVGALIVMRKRTGTFAAEEVAMLQTFATQSALAIQNARLFREIEDKSRQLEVASQHKSEFLANMSHELRTPLNAIIGFSEVLSDRMFGELNEKQEEYLKDIYASGTHLLSLINDILDLSKIEAGRMELELTDFHLPTAIENALMLVRERAGRRSLALRTNVDTRLGEIQADERKVRQVVLNLLSNAIKFTPEGGRIDVAAVPKDGFVEISVSDTGIGIAPEDQEQVFEEFRQVGTAAKKIEGTGLGLTLCRKFVELHGGQIWVKSQIGHGATFSFSLPMHRDG